ncbi:H+/Cl-antiporter ClcA [Bryocella elongata]|uniref:H+/Cl-antiporter ClcA n=1 Tax=Bryocella elongata TaxID=863522 RepID=A0A1H5ZBK5_9BACT|nr:chloride channel protein [Bryocella elongata]SEG33410.1 H+/Cl-antiporter ClcA [Bryocella elongata]
MPENTSRNLFSEQLHILKDLVRWIPIASVVGMMAGTASATLLASLTWATNIRESHRWLILLLAPAGWAVGLLYKLFGKSVEGGNNLILEEVHDPRTTIPARMTPLILLGTFISHLFGASVGREGTAIQTGASLADQLSGPLRLTSPERRILLMAGISAGFGSVFGTPMAGAVFGIEVLAIGKLSYDAIAPCFLAAFVGDLVTRFWARFVPGVAHTHYVVGDVPAMTVQGIVLAAIAGVAFGLAAMAFSRLTHFISHTARRFISRPEFRPIAGGLVVTAAVFALGSTRYIGLGVPIIVDAFHNKLPPYDFAGKLIFTAASIGTGFKGGEVTPLFYIGATLGNALSRLLPLPAGLLAGMGFAAVFAGAANTPISSTLLAVELFGGEAGAYAAIACVVSYLFSGHTGIYGSQRVGRSKFGRQQSEEGQSLAMLAKRDLGEGLITPGSDASLTPTPEPESSTRF